MMATGTIQIGAPRSMLQKKKIIIPGLVAIVLVGAALAFLFFFDFNRFKPVITKTVKNFTGRDLIINGDIRFLPEWPPVLTAEDITFQNAPWGSRPHMIRVKRLEFVISLLPMLHGEFSFYRLRLDEPEVLLEFDTAGVSNFLLDTGGSAGASAIPALAFNDIRIDNGRLDYKDRKAGLDLSMHVDNLQADIPGLDEPIRLRFDGTFKDLPCTLDGSIGPIMAWIQPGYTLPVDLAGSLGKAAARLKGTILDPVHLKNISLHFSANGPATREFTDLVNLKAVPDFGVFSIEAEVNDHLGQLALDRLAIDIGSASMVRLSIAGRVKNLIEMKEINLDLQVQTQHAGNLFRLVGLSPLPIEAPLQTTVTLSDAAENQFRLDDFAVTVGDHTIQGSMNLDLTRAHPVLDMRLRSEHATFGPFALETRISRSPDRISVENFELQAGRANLFKTLVTGAIGNLTPLEDLKLQFHVMGENLAHLQKLTGRPPTVRGPFAISGNLTMADRQTIQVPELKIILDKNSIKGSLGLEFHGGQPELKGVLTSNRLNLERLLTPATLPANLLQTLSAVGPSRLAFRLSGLVDRPSLNSLEFRTRVENLAELDLQGSIGNLLDMSATDLSFTVRGSRLANLEKVIEMDLPVEEPFSVSGRLHGRLKKAYRIENLEVSAALNTLKGHFSINLAKPNPVISVELGTEKLSVAALPDGLNPVLDRLKTRRNIGPLEIKATTELSGEGHALQAFDLIAGEDAFIRIQIKGTVGNLTSMQGLNLGIHASGRDISNLGSIVGRTIPMRGAFSISGLVSDHAPHNIMLSDLKLLLGQNRFAGWTNLNLAGQHPVIETELSADHFTFAPLTLSEVGPLRDIPDMGPFNLAFKIAYAGETPRVNYLDFSMGSENTIAAMLRGSVGRLDPLGGVSLDFAVTSKDLSILNNAYGTKFINELPFHVAGRFQDPRPELYTVTSLAATYGDSNLSGSAALDLAGQRPVLKAQLASEKMDLRSFLKKFSESDRSPQVPTRPAPSGGRLFSRRPFKLPDLNRLDADITYQGREVLFPRFAFNDVEIGLHLRNGDLNFNPFKFGIGGGYAESILALKSSQNPPSVEAILAVHQFDIGPMLEQLGNASTIEGTLDTSVHLTGDGNSMAALMAGLDGEIHLSISDGRIQSEQLALLERYLGSNVLDLFNPFKQQASHSRINCLINTIEIVDGQTDYKLVLDTEQTALAVAGTIDLKTEKIDIGIKPMPKKGFGDSQVGQISFSLKQLSQPFGIGGTLTKPHLILDPTRTVITAGKFTGAMLLGPVGLTLFFSDISRGKKNICEEAMQKKE